MTQISQSAQSYASSVDGNHPGVFHMPVNAIGPFAESIMLVDNKHKAGVLAQLYTILNSGDKMKNQVDACRRMIQSGLSGDAACDTLAKGADVKNFAELTKYNGKLTYRYITKQLPLTSMAALVATHSNDTTLTGILLSRMQHDTWTMFGSDYGFDEAQWLKAYSPLIPTICSQHGVKDIADLCGLYPAGPYPNGYTAGVAISVSDDSDDSVTLSTSVTTNTQGTNTMTTSTTKSLSSMNAAFKPIIDGILQQSGVSFTVDTLISDLSSKEAQITAHEQYKAAAEQQIASLRSAASKAAAMPSTINLVSTSGKLPGGTMKMVDVVTVFPELKGVNMQVPQFTWDAYHPDVPEINNDYVFRKAMLVSALRCLVTNENAWLVGHTGSGKTTFIEQIASRLNWPVARVAFDSNVDRSELVGRMNLQGDGKGGTFSEWLSGILERATSNGYILLCDEIDAGHPNALYTLQPVLEGKPLTLLEDGGRVIPRHPMTRIFATGNTTGNGDPSGLYPACRILSAATLDRFPNFINVPYMTVKEETSLIKTVVPGMANDLVQRMAKFGNELRTAFTSGQTPVSYSPRRSLAFAREVEFLQGLGFTDEKAILSTAFKSKLYDAASEEFRQRITEIANASLGGIDPNKTVL